MTNGIGISRTILKCLEESDEGMTLGEIEEATGFSPKQVSSHLCQMLMRELPGLSRAGRRGSGYGVSKGRMGYSYFYEPGVRESMDQLTRVATFETESSFKVPEDIHRPWVASVKEGSRETNDI